MVKKKGMLRALQEAVIARSVAKDWEHARREWHVSGFEIDKRAIQHCVCGQDGLVEIYTITNALNGNMLAPIGSVCIHQFGVDYLDDERKAWSQAGRLLDAMEHNGGVVDLKGGLFSRDLLRFLYDSDAFPPNRYNDGDGYNDYEFMLTMFNKRSDMTPRQEAKVKAVMRNGIYPRLREFMGRPARVNTRSLENVKVIAASSVFGNGQPNV